MYISTFMYISPTLLAIRNCLDKVKHLDSYVRIQLPSSVAHTETAAYVAAEIFHNIFVPFGVMHSIDVSLDSQNSLINLSFAAYLMGA